MLPGDDHEQHLRRPQWGGLMSEPSDRPCFARRKPDRRAASRRVLLCSADISSLEPTLGGAHDATERDRSESTPSSYVANAGDGAYHDDDRQHWTVQVPAPERKRAPALGSPPRCGARRKALAGFATIHGGGLDDVRRLPDRDCDARDHEPAMAPG